MCPPMKKNSLHQLLPSEGLVVAIFGESKLVRTGLNRFEILGGTHEDRDEAMEWMSFFLHGRLVHDLEPDRP